MNKLALKWEKITVKVNLLIDAIQQRDERIQKLQAQVSEIENKNEQLVKENKELNEKVNVLKLAKGVGLSNQERDQVKKQIEYYIDEIDDCLAKINA